MTGAGGIEYGRHCDRWVKLCRAIQERYPRYGRSTKQLLLDSSRLSILILRLSPIWGFGARYYSSAAKGFWICRPSNGQGARDIYVIMLADLEKYRRYVDRFDLDEAQKQELIHTVWAIMESFVDRAFGPHPARRCPGLEANGDSNDAPNRLASGQRVLKNHFKEAGGSSARQEDEDHEGE